MRTSPFHAVEPENDAQESFLSRASAPIKKIALLPLTHVSFAKLKPSLSDVTYAIEDDPVPHKLCIYFRILHVFYGQVCALPDASLYT